MRYAIFLLLWAGAVTAVQGQEQDLSETLANKLKEHGFTGKVESTLEQRLGRPVDAKKAELGRFLFFDPFLGLHRDNACAGCHSPTAGFADTQSIAIGVDSNRRVGRSRSGARNQRRTPSVINNAFYPSLMLNGRFEAISGDPFDNSRGFSFPEPEGTKRFPAGDPTFYHLLVAQAHIPPTELPEMAGFHGISGSVFATSRFQAAGADSLGYSKTDSASKIAVFDTGALKKPKLFSASGDSESESEEPDFSQFDDGHGLRLPPEDGSETRNEPIRTLVASLLNSNEGYREEFAEAFPEVANGSRITIAMASQAIAEFEFTLTFANAPIDQFARGDLEAMTDGQKRGAILFFGKAQCVNCHSVAGESNEMFSDFSMHCIAIPQIAPLFGKDKGNVPFRNADGEFSNKGNEDFGLWDITGNAEDKYMFRTSPLRNVSTQSTFFHNGAFTRLEDAIDHHLDVRTSAQNYNPQEAGVAADLQGNIGPIAPVLEQLDPLLQEPIGLSDTERADLLEFVRDGLLDPRAKPENLKKFIPEMLPSGEDPLEFEFDTDSASR